MNGAGHYAEAEKLDKMATETGTFEMALVLATRAQVHATLAAAAATVEPRATSDWREVLGIPPTYGPPIDGGV